MIYKQVIMRNADAIDQTGGDVFDTPKLDANGELLRVDGNNDGNNGTGKGTESGDSSTGGRGGDVEGNAEGASGSATGTTGAVVKEPETPANVQLTQEQLRELISSVSTKQSDPAAAPRKLSPEEIDKQLNVFRANEELVSKILGGGPEAAKAFQLAIDGAVRHAVTVAGVLHKQELDKFNGRVNPYIEFAQQVQAQQARANYLTDNPQHEGLEPLVEQVSKDMLAEGFKGSQKQVFAEVAKRVEAMATKLKIPRADPKAAGADKGTAAKTGTTRMSTVSAGGQGGANGAGGSSKDASDGEDKIWS